MPLWLFHLADISQAEHLTSVAPVTEPREWQGPCAWLKDSHITQASGARQLSTNGEALAACVWDTRVANLHSALSLWLPAADHLIIPAWLLPESSLSPILPILRLALRQSTKKRVWYPGWLTWLKERKWIFSFLVQLRVSVRWTWHMSWKMSGQELPSLWLQGIKSYHVLFPLHLNLKSSWPSIYLSIPFLLHLNSPQLGKKMPSPLPVPGDVLIFYLDFEV
jgi:hypothetical protein